MPSLPNCLRFMGSPKTQITPKAHTIKFIFVHSDSLTSLFTVKCRQPQLRTFIQRWLG